MKNKLVVIGLLLTLLFNMNGTQADAAGVAFKDITKSYWAYEDIQWAVGEEIIYGYTDGRFKPNTLLTESQFVAVMARYFYPFLTEQNGDIAKVKTQYRHLESLGITVPGMKNPAKKDQPITRITMARTLFESQLLVGTDQEVIDWMYDNKLTAGKGINNDKYTDFGGNDSLQRVQVAAFFKRAQTAGIVEAMGSMPKPDEEKNPFLKKFKSKEVYDNTNVVLMDKQLVKPELVRIAELNNAQYFIDLDRPSPATFYYGGTESGVTLGAALTTYNIGMTDASNKRLFTIAEQILHAAGLQGEEGELAEFLYQKAQEKHFGTVIIDLDYHGKNIICVNFSNVNNSRVFEIQTNIKN